MCLTKAFQELTLPVPQSFVEQLHKMMFSSLGVLINRLLLRLKWSTWVLGITKIKLKSYWTRELFLDCCQVGAESFQRDTILVVFENLIHVLERPTVKQCNCSLINNAHELQRHSQSGHHIFALHDGVQTLQIHTEDCFGIFWYSNLGPTPQFAIGVEFSKETCTMVYMGTNGHITKIPFMPITISKYRVRSSLRQSLPTKLEVELRVPP